MSASERQITSRAHRSSPAAASPSPLSIRHALLPVLPASTSRVMPAERDVPCPLMLDAASDRCRRHDDPGLPLEASHGRQRSLMGRGAVPAASAVCRPWRWTAILILSVMRSEQQWSGSPAHQQRQASHGRQRSLMGRGAVPAASAVCAFSLRCRPSSARFGCAVNSADDHTSLRAVYVWLHCNAVSCWAAARLSAPRRRGVRGHSYKCVQERVMQRGRELRLSRALDIDCSQQSAAF